MRQLLMLGMLLGVCAEEHANGTKSVGYGKDGAQGAGEGD